MPSRRADTRQPPWFLFLLCEHPAAVFTPPSVFIHTVPDGGQLPPSLVGGLEGSMCLHTEAALELDSPESGSTSAAWALLGVEG